MAKKILILSGSPKSDGNTSALIRWFSEGAKASGAQIEAIQATRLKIKSNGCLSCRMCQNNTEYRCAIKDEVSDVLVRMTEADVIVMATPLYFFGPSAQLKLVFDRMFSLYKWDNSAGTFNTPLKGKTLVLMASAYEDIGLDALEAPFKLTAGYTEMQFYSLLIPNAGVSGDILKSPGVRDKAIALGKEIAS